MLGIVPADAQFERAFLAGRQPKIIVGRVEGAAGTGDVDMCIEGGGRSCITNLYANRAFRTVYVPPVACFAAGARDRG